MHKTEKRIPEYVARGIALSKSRGTELARTHPEIANEYRNGAGVEELARKYSPDANISFSVARSSVFYALEELIDAQELKELRKQHHHNASLYGGFCGGTETYKRKTGCFGLSKEKRKEASHRGGKIAGAISGRANYDAGLGIASLTTEQLREQGIKMARKAGKVLFDDFKLDTDYGIMTEREYIRYLKENTTLTWNEITDCLNYALEENNLSHRRTMFTLRTIYNHNWRK